MGNEEVTRMRPKCILQPMSPESASSETSSVGRYTLTSSSSRKLDTLDYFDHNHHQFLDAIEDFILGPNENESFREEYSVATSGSSYFSERSEFGRLAAIREKRGRAPSPPKLPPRPLPRARRTPLHPTNYDHIVSTIESVPAAQEDGIPQDGDDDVLDDMLVGLSIPLDQLSPPKTNWRISPTERKNTRPSSPWNLKEISNVEVRQEGDCLDTRICEGNRQPPQSDSIEIIEPQPTTPALDTSSTEEFEIVFHDVGDDNQTPELGGSLWGNQALWERGPLGQGLSVALEPQLPAWDGLSPMTVGFNSVAIADESPMDTPKPGMGPKAEQTFFSKQLRRKEPNGVVPESEVEDLMISPRGRCSAENTTSLPPPQLPLANTLVEEIEVSVENNCSNELVLGEEPAVEVGGCPGAASPIYVVNGGRSTRTNVGSSGYRVVPTENGIELERSAQPELQPTKENHEEIFHFPTPDESSVDTRTTKNDLAAIPETNILSIEGIDQLSGDSSVNWRRRSFRLKRPNPFSRLEQYMKIPNESELQRPASALARFSPSLVWTQRRRSLPVGKTALRWTSPKVKVRSRKGKEVKKMESSPLSPDTQDLADARHSSAGTRDVGSVTTVEVPNQREDLLMRCPISSTVSTRTNDSRNVPQVQSSGHTTDSKQTSTTNRRSQSSGSTNDSSQGKTDEPQIQSACNAKYTVQTTTARSQSSASRTKLKNDSQIQPLDKLTDDAKLQSRRELSHLDKTTFIRRKVSPESKDKTSTNSSRDESKASQVRSFNKEGSGNHERLLNARLGSVDELKPESTSSQESPICKVHPSGVFGQGSSTNALGANSSTTSSKNLQRKEGRNFNSSIFMSPVVRKVLDIQPCPTKLRTLRPKGSAKSKISSADEYDHTKKSPTNTEAFRSNQSTGKCIGRHQTEKSRTVRKLAKVSKSKTNPTDKAVVAPLEPVIRDEMQHSGHKTLNKPQCVRDIMEAISKDKRKGIQLSARKVNTKARDVREITQSVSAQRSSRKPEANVKKTLKNAKTTNSSPDTMEQGSNVKSRSSPQLQRRTANSEPNPLKEPSSSSLTKDTISSSTDKQETIEVAASSADGVVGKGRALFSPRLKRKDTKHSKPSNEHTDSAKEPELAVSEETKRIVLMNSTLSSRDDSQTTPTPAEAFKSFQKLQEIHSAVVKAKDLTPSNKRVRKIRQAYQKACQGKVDATNKTTHEPVEDLSAIPMISNVSNASTLSYAEKRISKRLAADVELLAQIQKRKMELSDQRHQTKGDCNPTKDESLELASAAEILKPSSSKDYLLAEPASIAVLNTLCEQNPDRQSSETTTRTANFSVYKMAKWKSPRRFNQRHQAVS